MIAYPPISMSEQRNAPATPNARAPTTPHARAGSQSADDRKERILVMSPSNKGPVQFAAMPPNATPSNGSFKDGPAVPSTPASAPAAAEAPPLSVISYLTPKNILLKVIKAGIAKAKMSWWKSLLMAFMAGMYIGLGSLLMLTIMGGSPGLTTPIPNGTASVANPYLGIQKLLGGCVFPVGLLLLVILGGELVTGNVMYVGAAMLARKVTILEYVKNLGIVYFGNLLGSLFMAYFLAYLPEMLHTAPYLGFLQTTTVKKINNGWGVNFLRGIGCNWLVCAALFFALGSDEMIGKIVALWWPIMAFIALGYEHCVANMFILPLGLMEGADSHVGWFIAKNLIPVSLGNWVGGFVFLAVVEWVVFSEFFGEKLTSLDTRPGHKPEKGVKVHTLLAHPSNHPASPHFHWPNIHMPHLPGWMHMPHFFHHSPVHGEGAPVKEEEAQSNQSNKNTNNEPALENNPQPQPPLNGDFDVEMGRTNIV